MEPTFEASLKKTLEPCMTVAAERGAAYGDTWSIDNQISTFTTSTLHLLGLPVPSKEGLRLLLLAALVDVKDSRLTGGYHRDSVLDGVNYRAVFLALVDEWGEAVRTSDAQRAIFQDGREMARPEASAEGDAGSIPAPSTIAP